MSDIQSPERARSAVEPVPAGKSGPVTLILRRTVRPGRERAFETWLREISDASSTFPGYQGTSVLRPNPPGQQYVYIVRFDSYAHLRDWELSPERVAHLEGLHELVEGALGRQLTTGLEYWFSPPGAPLSAPPQQAKMAAVTLLGIYPLILLASRTLAPALDWLPLLLRELVVAAVLVVLMTYAVMPLLTRLLERWLLPDVTGIHES